MTNFDQGYRLATSRRVRSANVDSFAGWYGSDNLTRGLNPKNEDLRFVFALSAPAHPAAVEAVSDDGTWTLTLRRLGSSDIYAGAATFPEGTGFHWSYHVGTTKVGGGQLEAYVYPADSKVLPDVPKGVLTQQEPWHSKIYPDTTRDWWIYVPTQYDASKPACLTVVQDGQWARGYWQMPLDNLIAHKEIPVQIVVFITPGTIKASLDNRSVEYDTVSDKYVTMLANEILPEVERRYNIRPDAKSHMIAGGSSGAICSFNAAWDRPDLFSKVISWIGSFTNLQGGTTGVEGGNTYPAIIRAQRGWDKTGQPKPIRVFLQDGSNDVDNKAGNWPLANQEMAKALAYGGYDYRFVFGHGFHSDKQGRATLPDALRWIWRDEPK